MATDYRLSKDVYGLINIVPSLLYLSLSLSWRFSLEIARVCDAYFYCSIFTVFTIRLRERTKARSKVPRERNVLISIVCACSHSRSKRQKFSLSRDISLLRAIEKSNPLANHSSLNARVGARINIYLFKIKYSKRRIYKKYTTRRENVLFSATHFFYSTARTSGLYVVSSAKRLRGRGWQTDATSCSFFSDFLIKVGCRAFTA